MSSAWIVIASVAALIATGTLAALVYWKVFNGIARFFDALPHMPDDIRRRHGWREGHILTPSMLLIDRYRKARMRLRLLLWGSPPAFAAPSEAISVLGAARRWSLALLLFHAAIVMLLLRLFFVWGAFWALFILASLVAYAPLLWPRIDAQGARS